MIRQGMKWNHFQITDSKLLEVSDLVKVFGESVW